MKIRTQPVELTHRMRALSRLTGSLLRGRVALLIVFGSMVVSTESSTAEQDVSQEAQQNPAAERVFFPARSLFSSNAALERAIQELAAVSKPHVIPLEVGSDLVGLLRTEYLDAAESMWPFVVRANSYDGASDAVKALIDPYKSLPRSIPVMKPVQRFVLPIGPRWSLKPSVVKAGPNDTVDTISAKYLGAVVASSPAVAILRAANPNVNLRGSIAGVTLVIPERSFPIIIRRIDPTDNISASTGVKNDGRADVLRPTSPISSSAHPCVSAVEDWPVNWSGVLRVLQANETWTATVPRQEVVVAVIDSGVAQGEPQLGRIRFWTGGPDNGVGFDETAGGGGSRPQTPWESYQDQMLRDHGTHVAGLIHGGATVDSNRSRLKQFSQIMVLKVVSEDQSGGVISPDAMIRGIRDALEIGRATVINISVNPSDSPARWSELSQHEGALFIVAAGNGYPVPHRPQYHDLDDEALDPADLGGSKTSNVVSVAAHDGTMHLPSFTNRGKESVTLAAPGCSISSYIADPSQPGEMTGTSQAAPIVTAAAAILSSYGLSAKESKQRIIASVEMEDTLSNVTFSGGFFSFEKTIDIFNDLLIKVPLRAGGVIDRGIVSSSDVNTDQEYVIKFRKNTSNTFTEIPISRVLKLTVTDVRRDRVFGRLVYSTADSKSETRIENGEISSKMLFAMSPSPPEPIVLEKGVDIVVGPRVKRREPEARTRPRVPLATLMKRDGRFVFGEKVDASSETEIR